MGRDLPPIPLQYSDLAVSMKRAPGIEFVGKRSEGMIQIYNIPAVDQRELKELEKRKRAPGMEFVGKRAPGMEFVGKRVPGMEFIGKRAPGMEFVGK